MTTGSKKNFQDFPKSLKEWASENNSEKQELIGVGYSLGSRLLLHTILSHPHLFKKAIIIGAHTGLTNDGDKKTRLAADKTVGR